MADDNTPDTGSSGGDNVPPSTSPTGNNPPSSTGSNPPPTGNTLPFPTGSNPPPSTAAPAPSPAPVPKTQVLTQQTRHGLAGVMDSVRNWIAGTQGYGVYMDQDGNRFVSHPPLSASQQWRKVGLEALVGASQGLAAGQGPGGRGRAAAAGVSAGMGLVQQQQAKAEDEAEKDYARTRQAKIDKANDQIRQLQISEGQFRLDRLKVTATQDQIKFAEEQDDRYEKQHGVNLGIYNSYNIHEVEKAHPELWKNHFNENSIRTVPQYKTDGTPDGVRVWYIPPGQGNQMMPPDTQLPQYTPNAKDPTQMGTTSYYTPTDPMSRDEYESRRNDYQKQVQDDQTRVLGATNIGLKQLELKNAPEKAAQELKESKAKTAEAYGAAAESQAKAKAAEVGAGLTGTGNTGLTGEAYLNTIAPENREQVRAIARGDVKMPPASRAPANMAIRNMVMQYDPNYSEARYTAVQSFKAKDDSRLLSNLTTMAEHLDRYNISSKDAGTVVSKTLSGPAAALDKDTALLSQEAGKLVKNGVLTQGEYEDIKAGLDSRLEYKRQRAVGELTQLVRGRVDSIFTGFKRATGIELPVNTYIPDQASQDRMRRLGLMPEDATAPQGGGGTYKHTASGPGGQLGTNDDPNDPNAKWFDVKTGALYGGK